ncbi:efflux RND transporter periplasmic adaptor subunit [Taklimakanibacter lacteus]|uniref:efflux RND transporter periplasmic adaptor subunit n=1 Tax=Taklimakanibacter lacteus TaxID=2268456 RepID=UPI000E6711D2
MRIFIIAGLLALALAQAAVAATVLKVMPTPVADEKAVFATVESLNVVPARARIGGTLAGLTAREGDHVEQGQIIARIGDEKLVLQMKSLDAQIAGLEAQRAQAETDFTRIKTLVDRGTLPRTRLDEAQTSLRVAENALQSRTAERLVIGQQLSEGDVFSPAAGRILKVPLTAGAVLLAGETVATIARQDFVLRLRVPERHARALKAGDMIRLDGSEIGEAGPRFGKITLVYPQIEDGRVMADAVVAGLGDYFVSERLRVWISGGERLAIVIPASFVTTRFGVDYVRLRQGEAMIDVPVQRGRDLPRPDMPDGVEILSGLRPGDELVQP